MRKYLIWIFVLVVWAGLTYTPGGLPGIILPQPHKVIIAFLSMFLVPMNRYLGNELTIWPHLWATLTRTLAGFAWGASFGITTGIINGSFKKIGETTEPLINFLRAIPVTALFPLFMLVFGIGNASKIAMAAFGAGLVMVVGSYEGVRNVSKDVLEAAQLDGAEGWQLIKHVTWKLSLPHIWTSARIAVNLAFVLVIVSEITIGTNLGIGSVASNSTFVYATDYLYAVIILMGLLGLGVNWFLSALRPRILNW